MVGVDGHAKDLLEASDRSHARTRDDVAFVLENAKAGEIRLELGLRLLKERGVVAVRMQDLGNAQDVTSVGVSNHGYSLVSCALASTRIILDGMAAKRRTQPRKKPQQSRARETVAAIIEAAAHILEAKGYRATNVNQVAKKAGVSIGSLYQYFPSKAALVAAVAEDLAARGAAHFEGIEDVASLDPPDAIDAMVRRAFAVYRLRPRLRRVIENEVPEVAPHFATPELDAAIRAAIEAYIAERLTDRRARVSAHVVMSAVQGVAERTADDPSDETLNETVAMIRAYLLG